ncbi:unnamed protein product [Ilex paraguariensis]|uniref:Alcohol dehydrogenase-like N-terminal domain-containing protein n=1 Tax=Ilex paraguariensis TaxID=185542 RepID=A0ABC8SSP4_9AQUA
MAKSPEEQHPVKAFGWAARDPSGVLSPFKFSRRATGDEDVKFKVLYCGICHSDLHSVKNEWGFSQYPVLPGHEIVGEVTEVGSKVKKFKVGDKVGVGCMVGSCHSCDNCANDLENYCPKFILTYDSTYYDGTPTYGVGLGGLGHVGVKFAKALGVKVTVISTSPSKKEEAIEHIGADSFLVSRDPDQMQIRCSLCSSSSPAIARSVEISWEAGYGWCTREAIGATSISFTHGQVFDHYQWELWLTEYLHFLSSPFMFYGFLSNPFYSTLVYGITGRKLVAGSGIGGMKETQEMIDFAAEHNITADIEVIPMDYVNTAMERLVKADVRYRFVIDVGNTLKAA